jgi:hypothetical protein
MRRRFMCERQYGLARPTLCELIVSQVGPQHKVSYPPTSEEATALFWHCCDKPACVEVSDMDTDLDSDGHQEDAHGGGARTESLA